jgi:predicted membrane-bound mannosyltransferase
MVFYSRYYIMEMLMVFFTFGLIGCGWRFYLSRQTGWMVGAGIFAGLMHATKETCVLQFAAIAVGLVVVWMADLFSAGSGMGVVNRGRKNPIKKSQILALLVAAVVTSVLIFSKFFTDWRAVYDSVATYWGKLDRAQGQGHQKTFFYYLGLIWGGPMSAGPSGDGVFSGDFWKNIPEMLGIKPSGRIVWGERLLLLLAGIGMITAFVTQPSRNQSRHLVRFLAVYSVAVFVIYSAISYKTPWLVIGPWHGMLIMAGVGAAGLIRLVEGKVGRFVMAFALALVMAHAGLLAFRATRGKPSFAADGRNPMNYSMTSPDCLDWVEKFHRFGEVSGKGNRLAIVQADSQGGWPLPWYLSRKFPNYVWQGGDWALMEQADVILSGMDFRDNLPESVRGPAEPNESAQKEWEEFSLTLHPSARLAVFVRKSIWTAYLAKSPWPTVTMQQ